MSLPVFTPEQVAAMRQRMAELHAEFMAESDPAAWPRLPTETDKVNVYRRKLHSRALLRMMADLQRILERIPAPAGRTAGDETAQHVAEARKLGAALRERLKGGVQ
jgi:hypothetical protein